jgi:hypothetical protein
MKSKKILYFIISFLFIFSSSLVFSQEEAKKEEQLAGELFGVSVPIGNYYFVKGAIIVFGNRFGPQPRTDQELEDCTWNDLVLSYEAFRRNIAVAQEEVEAEITKMLTAEKAEFDWKADKEAYTKWVKDKTNEPQELFENQLKHLLQLQKLRNQVMEGIVTTATEDEAHQEFLDEYNTLGIELLQFDELKDAEDFYQKSKKDTNFWEAEKKKEPAKFKRPGFVALEFLMDMWKLPKEAAYKMIGMQVGEIYGPSPIYKGYGVFKILEKRPAQEEEYPKIKDSYYKQIQMKKKYEALNEWVKSLKTEANIKVYKQQTVEVKE